MQPSIHVGQAARPCKLPIHRSTLSSNCPLPTVGAAALDAASDAVVSAAVDALTDPDSEPAAALQQAVEQGDPTVLLPDVPDDPELAAVAAQEVAAGAVGQLFSRGAGKLAAASKGGWGRSGWRRLHGGMQPCLEGHSWLL